MTKWSYVNFLSLYGACFIKGHPVREEICKCHSTSVKLMPDHPWSPFSYDEKAKRWFVCQLRNVRRPTLNCPVYFGWNLSSDKRKWEMWWRFQSYGTPLVEEKQRCNVTWIFLQVFNQDEKMALFDSSLLSTMFLLDRTEPQSLCMFNLRKSSNNFNMTYWLFSMRWPVLLLLQPIQVTVLTASLSWVYSIYILVYLFKQKNKFIHFQEKLLLRFFVRPKYDLFLF